MSEVSVAAGTLTEAEELLRDKLAAGCRILAMEGHADANLGHMSARMPGSALYWMKASGVGLEEITPDDLVLLDYEGNHQAGMRKRHNEYPIHAEIYRARPDVNAVIHTHPLHSTVFAAMKDTLRPITHEGILFARGVPYFEETTDLIITREQGESVARAIASSNALFMRNHGIVVVGSSVEEACVLGISLEKAAKAQLLARSAGEFVWTPDEEIEGKIKNIFGPVGINQKWTYYRRRVAAWNGF